MITPTPTLAAGLAGIARSHPAAMPSEPAVRLHRGERLRILEGKGRRVRCLSGTAWVTQDHDRRDVILEPGQGFTLDRPGLAIVQALGGHCMVTVDPEQGPRIRAIRPDDQTRLQHLIGNLSARARRLRFHAALRELPSPIARRFTRPDHRSEMGYIATVDEGADELAIAHAQYIARSDAPGACEIGLVVAERWQGRGIGRRLLWALIDHAEQVGFRLMTGDVLAENAAMLHLARRLGFAVLRQPDSALRIQRPLLPRSAAPADGTA